ncbi:MAG: family 10 glycosylhydrolase [Eudoraea sp.]|uniref:glycoside hydrolase family 10 protein n=1 Tax=Eudoraea sp. TaxID=1979955 RepID=UPI003C749074
MLRKTCFLLLLFLTSCQVHRFKKDAPKTEFRGVWIATVANIDWPKEGGSSWEKQKEDYREFLRFYKKLNFNAVIVQIRTAGDALYPTELAPWSRFLTGKEGHPPISGEDPLAWMIQETHSWGFEFHAWFNPYRATVDLNTSILSETHDFHKHPDWLVPYGTKYYYNPGIPEVQQHFINIIDEVVSKYDIDGVHFDDYFYPYRIKDAVFEDAISFNKYALKEQNLEDWRRANIDSLVKNTFKIIKKNKPWVQFGISPFGVWKNNTNDPKGSATKAGQTTYHDLYADPLLWMNEGWLDYLVPQLYWSLKLPVASHKVLANWWVQNAVNTNLYIGNGAYKVQNNSDPNWDKLKELPRQISLGRKLETIQGNVFFSAKSLIKDREEVVDYLKSKTYPFPSFPPESPNTDGPFEKIPQIEYIEDQENFLKIHYLSQNSNPLLFANVYRIKSLKNKPNLSPTKLLTRVAVIQKNNFTLGKGLFGKKEFLALTFTDSYRRESQPIIIHLNQIQQYDTKK